MPKKPKPKKPKAGSPQPWTAQVIPMYAKGLTEDEIATKLRVSKGQVSKILSGQMRVWTPDKERT